MYVEFSDFAQTGTARTASCRVVERKRVGIADKRLANTRKQKSQQRLYVGVGADSRTAVRCRFFLVDDYRHGHVFDFSDLGATVFRQVLLYEARKCLVQLAAAFGGNGVEAKR